MRTVKESRHSKVPSTFKNVVDWKNDNYDLIVVGGGISGATIAYIAGHDYHQKVLVLEKEVHIGGALYDEREKETGMLVQRYGSHFLHTDNGYVYEFLRKFGDWTPFQLTAGTRLNGKSVSIPFHYGSIDVLYPPEEAAALKAAIAEEYNYEKYVSLMDMLRSEKKQISDFAKLLLRKHFIPLHAARFSQKSKKINGDIMRDAFFQLGYADGCYANRYQMLPNAGFAALIKKMLSDPFITVKTNVNAAELLEIKPKKEKKTGHQNCVYFCGRPLETPIVYTGSIDELFGYKFGRLPYHQIGIDYQISEKHLPYCCMNFPGESYYSCSDFSKFNGDYGDKLTVISREHNTKLGFCAYPKINGDSIKTYQKYRRLVDQTKNLFLAGRLANYHFIQIDDAVTEAMNLIERIPFADIDLTPDYVAYKRPPEQLLDHIDNYKKNAAIKSELIIGNLKREAPEITVIIPTYKRLTSLKRALQSVWNQDITEAEYEVLILDNDPQRGNETEEYLLTLKDKKNLFYYKNRKNLGAYGNMNRCMELARTDWIAMLHDDDVMFPNALRWALNSKRQINDSKLGIIIPKQIQVYSKSEVLRRMKESGVLDKDLVVKRQRSCRHEKKRWLIYLRAQEGCRRRFWRISKFDCYMIPFLYPAPSYGTLINRKAMLDVGGYSEGYPTDDNLCCVKMSEKYHCYLCGEAWGLYSFYTADVTKPRSALQFVDAIVQYRLYMEKRSFACRLMGKLMRQAAYIDAVEGDFWFGKTSRGYNVGPQCYQYYNDYHATERDRSRAQRMRKIWEFWVYVRTYLFGKRIDFDMVKRCNGEHV